MKDHDSDGWICSESREQMEEALQRMETQVPPHCMVEMFPAPSHLTQIKGPLTNLFICQVN